MRGRRAVWLTAMVCFLAAVPTAAFAQRIAPPDRTREAVAPAQVDESRGTVIFAADFDADRPLNPPDEWPKWRYENGAFVVTYPGGRSPMGYLAFRDDIGRLPARVRIEVTVTLLSGRSDEQFGIEFGHDLVEGSSQGSRASLHPYQFGITGDEQTVLYAPQPSWLNRQVSFHVNPPGEPNLIVVEIDETRVRCYVNGSLADVHVALEPVTGFLGFYVGGGVEVAFDDLRIEELR